MLGIELYSNSRAVNTVLQDFCGHSATVTQWEIVMERAWLNIELLRSLGLSQKRHRGLALHGEKPTVCVVFPEKVGSKDSDVKFSRLLVSSVTLALLTMFSMKLSGLFVFLTYLHEQGY